LGKEIVKGDGESEVNPVKHECVQGASWPRTERWIWGCFQSLARVPIGPQPDNGETIVSVARPILP
jgi:hypothetical protein